MNIKAKIRVMPKMKSFLLWGPLAIWFITMIMYLIGLSVYLPETVNIISTIMLITGFILAVPMIVFGIKWKKHILKSGYIERTDIVTFSVENEKLYITDNKKKRCMIYIDNENSMFLVAFNFMDQVIIDTDNFQAFRDYLNENGIEFNEKM